MMNKNIDYNEWLSLSASDREALKKSWDPYKGDGADILQQTCARFQKEFGKPEGLINVHCGLYHGGVLIIGVSIRAGSRICVPKSFEGFPVVKMVNTGVDM